MGKINVTRNADGYVITFDMKGFDNQKVDMEINEIGESQVYPKSEKVCV